MSLSDAAALCWARDTLTGSGLFETVRIGRLVRPVGSAGFPSAWVFPIGFSESDDVDPVELVRTLRYAVAISIRAEDPDDELGAIEAMDTLSNKVANLLSGDGPDESIPGLTRIDSGRYDVLTGSLTDPLSTNGTPNGGNFSAGLTLMGTIAYFVEGRAGRDTED
jgi:hypothetical protein